MIAKKILSVAENSLMFVNPVAFAAVKAGKALYEHFTDEFSDSKLFNS